MLRMQEMTFPRFKFQKFSGGVQPPDPPFMRGILATHVAELARQSGLKTTLMHVLISIICTNISLKNFK